MQFFIHRRYLWETILYSFNKTQQSIQFKQTNLTMQKSDWAEGTASSNTRNKSSTETDICCIVSDTIHVHMRLRTGTETRTGELGGGKRDRRINKNSGGGGSNKNADSARQKHGRLKPLLIRHVARTKGNLLAQIQNS